MSVNSLKSHCSDCGRDVVRCRHLINTYEAAAVPCSCPLPRRTFVGVPVVTVKRLSEPIAGGGPRRIDSYACLKCPTTWDVLDGNLVVNVRRRRARR